MKHYIDQDGEIFAFATDGSQDDLISDNLKPVTLPDSPQSAWIIDYENGKIQTDVDRLLDFSKSAALHRINAAYEAELASIRSEYPESEQMTWDKQEREARAYIADSASATPLLDAMATGRGMDKSELATRIIAKADAWMQASGLATGKRQAREDQVKAAETVEAVEAISWE